MSDASRSWTDLLARLGLSETSRRTRVAVAAIGVAILVLALVRWLPGSGSEGVVFEDGAAAAATAPSGDPGSIGAGQGEAAGSSAPALVSVESSVVVHVAGSVRRPGIVYLSPGARIADAIAAAGGAIGDAALDAVNLARQLADGEQVYIPTKAEVDDGLIAPSIPAPGGVAGGGDGAVNINSATASELESLPGIGPATAQKIIEDRETNGPFCAVEDLMRVSGIGEKRLEDLRDSIVIR